MAKRTKKPSWRASWKGELRLGLVRFTAEAVNAHSKSGSDIHFHQLHAECHSRIEHEKVCPVHGEVEQAEIVLGYDALMVAMLNFEDEIRDVADMHLPKAARSSAANLKTAKALVSSMEAKRFDFSRYEDRYRDQVKKLIAAKRKGKEIVAPPEEEEEEPVIDFIEAMKRSISQQKKRSVRKPRRRKAV